MHHSTMRSSHYFLVPLKNEGRFIVHRIKVCFSSNIFYNVHFTWRKCILCRPDKVQQNILWCYWHLCIKILFNFENSIGKYSFTDTWCTQYPMTMEGLWSGAACDLNCIPLPICLTTDPKVYTIILESE